jgi:hypothetical protein
MYNNDPTDNHRPTMTVPEVGRRYFGLGRNASYAAAARGDFPTVRIGKRLFVPTAAIDRILAASIASCAR